MPPFGGYDTRLPTPGGDNNIWGYILENFLAVSFQYAATSGGVNGYLNTTVNTATSSTAGFITLAGDLSNTYQVPQVVSTHLSSALPVNQGGTGQTTLSSNGALIGNGTSGITSVAPGSNGNVLTASSGAWVSSPASGGTTQRTFAFFVS